MNPPRLATWLLLTLGAGPDMEAIAGDLREQYLDRSRLWYWRQVGYAIALGTLQHLKHHWVLAMRAIWIGGAVMGITDWILRYVAYWFLGPVLGARVSPSSVPVILLVSGVPAFVAGWVVGRLHRPHGAPFALALAVVVLPIQLLPRLVFLIRNSLQHERFLPYLWGYVAGVPVLVAVVLGGMLLGVVIGQSAGERLREGQNTTR